MRGLSRALLPGQRLLDHGAFVIVIGPGHFLAGAGIHQQCPAGEGPEIDAQHVAGFFCLRISRRRFCQAKRAPTSGELGQEQLETGQALGRLVSPSQHVWRNQKSTRRTTRLLRASGRGSRSDFIVIIGHGVTGNKDRPFVVALAEGLSAASIPTLCMSFAGNGDSGGTFADCTISKETDDLGSVIDAMGDRKICYIGHSMGGAVGVRRASSDSRIDALVSLAGMVHTEEFARREFGEETPDAGCMWEEESCPLSSTFMNDMAAIRSVVDLGAEISVPWLLVHGTEDDVVPIGDTHDIIAKATNSPEFFEIAGANHVFSDEALPVMVAKVVRNGWGLRPDNHLLQRGAKQRGKRPQSTATQAAPYTRWLTASQSRSVAGNSSKATPREKLIRYQAGADDGLAPLRFK